jgi:hypothetical protein
VQNNAALAWIDAKPSACCVGAAAIDAERRFRGEARAITELKIGVARGGERDERRHEEDSLSAE